MSIRGDVNNKLKITEDKRNYKQFIVIVLNLISNPSLDRTFQSIEGISHSVQKVEQRFLDEILASNNETRTMIGSLQSVSVVANMGYIDLKSFIDDNILHNCLTCRTF